MSTTPAFSDEVTRTGKRLHAPIEALAAGIGQATGKGTAA